MGNAETSYVVDASVGIKLFLKEPFNEQAFWLFEGLKNSPPLVLHVPDLFFIECTNILWKYTWRFGRNLEDSLADLRNLRKLKLEITSTTELIEEALSIAIDKHLTAYDACYAVLAYREGIKLVTADKQICKQIPWAVWLGNLDTKRK